MDSVSQLSMTDQWAVFAVYLMFQNLHDNTCETFYVYIMSIQQT